MLTYKDAQKLLSYDSKTGIFKWKVMNSNRIKVGDIAGSLGKNYGYIEIGVNGKTYKAHRLAWLFVYKRWPNRDIDHLNGVRSDNRICNLREVDKLENNRNARLNKNNKSGDCGVRWLKTKNKWRAEIGINYKNIHLGLFTNKQDAIKARKLAEKKYGFHKNHGKK